MSNPGLIERARQMLNAASHSSAGQYPARQNNTKKTNAKAANHTPKGKPKPIWMETEGSVTECQSEFIEIDAFHPGRANEANKFTVSFTYYAHARTYYDRFTSTEVKAQGECFSVFYNALDPNQNTKSVSESENRSALSVIGIAAYILISVLSLLMARG